MNGQNIGDLYSLLITRFGLCFESYKNALKNSEYNWLWWLYEAVKHNMDGETFYMVFNKFPAGTEPVMAIRAPDGKTLVNCGPLGWFPKSDRTMAEEVSSEITVYFRSRDSNGSIEKPFGEALNAIYQLTMRYMKREAEQTPLYAPMYGLLLEKLSAAGTPRFNNIGFILLKTPGSKQALYDSLVSTIHEVVLLLRGDTR